MKKNKVMYWISTAIVSLMMLFSAYLYLTSESVKSGFIHLGFPSYFRIELAIAKILGSVVLLIPGMPNKLKEFAYFGFGMCFVSAFIAHIFSGDPGSIAIMPLVFLVLLTVSYLFYVKVSAGDQKQLLHQ